MPGGLPVKDAERLVGDVEQDAVFRQVEFAALAAAFTHDHR